MAETATATIVATQLDATDWQYSITLDDTGSTTVGTFWFAWVPGKDFLATNPTSITDPAGWHHSVTHGGTGDGYAIQWTATSGSNDLASLGTLTGFSFDSTAAPSAMFGNSVFYPGTPVTTSFVYAGAPFSDGGFQFTATQAACFRAGTRILTEHGEVAVDRLQVGDRVLTALDGTAKPIAWIGQREVDCARHPRPEQVWPVRVSADALGPGRPHSDVFLSPDHAIHVNDLLIPVRHLTNGGTIAQVPAGQVTYYHIELAAHDVLLAQGLPVESFLRMNGDAYDGERFGLTELHPDGSVAMWEAFGCAPLVVAGPDLSAARALIARFSPQRAAA